MATTTTTIGDDKQQVLDNRASYARAQHIHIASHNSDDDINYGDKVVEVDNKALYTAPQDSNDVNNYGDKVNKVDDNPFYNTLPNRQQ